MVGLSATILAFQDYRWSKMSERRTNRRILLAVVAAFAVVHFGVLGLWPYAAPTFTAQKSFFDNNWGYPVFPVGLPWFLEQPVKMFEVAVFIAGSCVFLLTHPTALAPAIIDILYCAGSNKGFRDHSMVLSTIGLLPVLGVRASLFEGGTPWKNGVLVGSALIATLYGHVMAGRNGLVSLALAPDPPRPHLADITSCIPPGQRRCVVVPELYAGFTGHCERVEVYRPADLKTLQIEDDATTVFVAPTRLEYTPKGRPYGAPGSREEALSALAAKIRTGTLHATTCPPWFVLVHSPRSAMNDPAAVDRLEPPFS